MNKKEYKTPVFEDLGVLGNVTMCNISGDNFDGVLPDEDPDHFGS